MWTDDYQTFKDSIQHERPKQTRKKRKTFEEEILQGAEELNTHRIDHIYALDK